jgi:hypothetical protein
MFASETRIANHRLLSRLGQSACLSHAIALDDMFDNGNDFVVGKSSVKENGPSTLGKRFFALQTVEQACGFRTILGIIPGTHADIFSAANAVLGAIFIRTAKLLQVVHDCKGERKLPKRKGLRERAKDTN